MSTDDRDIESSNPSKNFKVGDFDQRSGFFTPVWESKRRIRSEPPVPPSSAAASSRGARSPSSAPAPDAAASAREGSSSGKGAGKGSKGSTPRPRAASGGKRSGGSRGATPVPPSTSELVAATLGASPLPPAVAAVFDPAVELEPDAKSTGAAPAEDAPVAAASPAAEAASPSEAPARPSAAARALREAGPDLPPAAFLDAEPEFRAARGTTARGAMARSGASLETRTDRSPVHQRSLRATSAAARVHEQLKAKLQAEAAELDESRFELAPDSQLPELPVQDEHDPYPQSLLRRLRRTIRLSTPVPDRIRSLISKYDRG